MNNLNNEVKLIGNVGQIPELKQLSNGNHVVNVSLATNESYKDSQGVKIEKTQWHNCTAWGKTAEIIGEYVKKGSKLAISGKLEYKTYDDKDGVKRTSTTIVINEFLMLDSKV